MQIQTGSVVIAKAGRDKGRPFVVVEIPDSRTALTADGKRRPLERPKKRNIIHLQVTATRIDRITTNRQLRKDLREFSKEA